MPPGLRKGLPMGGVILSFPPSSFDNFYTLVEITPLHQSHVRNLAAGTSMNRYILVALWMKFLKKSVFVKELPSRMCEKGKVASGECIRLPLCVYTGGYNKLFLNIDFDNYI